MWRIAGEKLIEDRFPIELVGGFKNCKNKWREQNGNNYR